MPSLTSAQVFRLGLLDRELGVIGSSSTSGSPGSTRSPMSWKTLTTRPVALGADGHLLPAAERADDVDGPLDRPPLERGDRDRDRPRPRSRLRAAVSAATRAAPREPERQRRGQQQPAADRSIAPVSSRSFPAIEVRSRSPNPCKQVAHLPAAPGPGPSGLSPIEEVHRRDHDQPRHAARTLRPAPGAISPASASRRTAASVQPNSVRLERLELSGHAPNPAARRAERRRTAPGPDPRGRTRNAPRHALAGIGSGRARVVTRSPQRRRPGPSAGPSAGPGPDPPCCRSGSTASAWPPPPPRRSPAPTSPHSPCSANSLRPTARSARHRVQLTFWPAVAVIGRLSR